MSDNRAGCCCCCCNVRQTDYLRKKGVILCTNTSDRDSGDGKVQILTVAVFDMSFYMVGVRCGAPFVSLGSNFFYFFVCMLCVTQAPKAGGE